MTQPPSSPTGGQPPDVAAYCYRHPRREAGVRCIRCDRPICGECMLPASVGFQCPDDVRAGSRSIRPTRTPVGGRLRNSPPYVTITLIALNVLIYIYTGTQSVAGFNDPAASRASSLFNRWQELPVQIHDDGAYYQLITSAFLHISLLHIGSNMLALGLVGPSLEALLGRWRFTAAYLIAGLGGSAAVYAFGNPLGPTVGASGAIFGLFGVALVLMRRLGLDAQWLIGTIVLNFVLTFSISSISKLGHVGGFVSGLLVGVAIGGLPARWLGRDPAVGGRGYARVARNVQLAGLSGVASIVVIVVAIRSATW